MRMVTRIVSILSVCMLLSGIVHAQDFQTTHASDNVLLISNDKSGENQVVITSERGLVVFNTFWAQNVAEEFKQAIAKALQRDDFAYTINTVDRLDMFGGNAAYEGTEIIGQRAFEDKFRGKKEEVDGEVRRLINMWQRKVGFSEERLKTLEAGSEAAAEEQSWANTCRQRAEDLTDNYSLVLPDVVYDDTLTVNLGNINLKLIWLGKAGNYNGMTIAVVPEEKVAIISGFIINPQHFAPYPYNDYAPLDVPRWISVLEEVLEGDNAVETVICGMGEIWPRERAHFYLDYIRGLWNAIRKADAEGKSLAEIQDQLSLDNDFAFVKDLQAYKDGGDDWFRPQHRMHIKVWYLQNKNLASEIIRNAAPDSVLAALAGIRDVRDSGGDVYFDEDAINGLGYYFMNSGKMPEAVDVLKLNTEAFPESANAYDSLAEAYMKSGDKENAIKNYKKSLALNPENENAKSMLEQLENI